MDSREESSPGSGAPPASISRQSRTERTGIGWEFARYTILLGCGIAVFLSDQILKALVVHSLSRGRHIDLLGGLVRVDFTRNSGAAFGMFPSSGLVFAAVAIVVTAGILIFFRQISNTVLPVRLALGLILGGAVGNLVDRVRLGYVVDYVDLRWWYVFNLADSAIVLGVGILLLQSGVESRSRTR